MTQPGSTSTWAWLGRRVPAEGVSGQLPWLRPGLWQQGNRGPETGTGPRGQSKTRKRGWDSALLTPSPGQGCERTHSQPPPATPLWPGTGPTSGPAEGPGQGRAGCWEPTLACSCCFCRPICCSISSYSRWTSRWWSESRLEGVGGGPGSAGHSWPCSRQRQPGPGLENIYCSLRSVRDP